MEVCKRAAGRRRYHAVRRRAAYRRRYQVGRALDMLGWPGYGVGRKLARQFGVSEATISRDIADLESGGRCWARSETEGAKHR